MDIEKVITEKVLVINKKLYRLIPDHAEPKELYEPIRYVLRAGGKRIRPVLCLLACEAVNGDYRKALPFACALELVHNFTLVHDDIMDKDETRRGKKTVHIAWGYPTAILSGDSMFGRAFESVAESSKMIPKDSVVRVLSLLARSIRVVCEGQMMDMSFAERRDISIKDYLEMVRRKTGVLIEASVKGGAIIGEGKPEEILALGDYAKNLGIAFQVQDDLLDLLADEAKLGKPLCSDIMKGKRTLPVVHVWENGTEEQRERLTEILDKPSEETTQDNVNEALSIMNDVGSIDYAKLYNERLIKNAKNSLKELRASHSKDVLIGVADHLTKREF